MISTTINSWQAVHDEVLNRIRNRVWKPGDQIPNETDLANEFGCARATMNRALQALAEAGVLERKRKGGTRVTLHPVRRATLAIPIIREQIESKDCVYSYRLLEKQLAKPPAEIGGLFGLSPNAQALHLRSVHFSDDAPYVYEDRWINLASVPESAMIDYDVVNANEWLILNVPFTDCEIKLYAQSANKMIAKTMQSKVAEPLLAMQRTTFYNTQVITHVTHVYHAGYSMVSSS